MLSATREEGISAFIGKRKAEWRGRVMEAAHLHRHPRPLDDLDRATAFYQGDGARAPRQVHRWRRLLPDGRFDSWPSGCARSSPATQGIAARRDVAPQGPAFRRRAVRATSRERSRSPTTPSRRSSVHQVMERSRRPGGRLVSPPSAPSWGASRAISRTPKAHLWEGSAHKPDFPIDAKAAFLAARTGLDWAPGCGTGKT